MKRFLLCLIAILNFSIAANASEILNLPYKNLKEEQKIKIENDCWTAKVPKQDSFYFIKFISDGSGNYSEFFASDGQFAFSTGTQYEFIHKGDLIGYSNHDLKFYAYTFIDGKIVQRKLTEEEIQAMFPDFTIVKISEFSQHTNSLKIKKNAVPLKLILLNDTDKCFYHYSFSSGNSKFEKYPLTGFLNIKKKGMIQFSLFGDNTKENPWFIILVR